MTRDLLGIAALVAVLLVAPLGATSPYFLITPGGTWDVGSRVTVPEDVRKPVGRMAFTAVYEQEANWGEVARARVVGQAEVVPATDIRPPGTTQQQVNETNRRLIDESKPVAAVVGLRAAGYDVQITGQGSQVESVIQGMPADGVLRPRDIIVAADGQPTPTTTSLVETIRRHQVGDRLRLTIQRDGQQQDVDVGTANSPSEPGRPVVGVTISTYMFDVRTPFQVNIESDNVGGPSAGLMFALGILDAVTDGDLTRGYFVAGTGTIAPDGTVGPVGGAAEKALAAEHDGAQFFLVPRDNADEAKRWVNSIQIVPVERFDDAVRSLCALDPRPDAEASPVQPAPCANR
ncbi:MAG TPA: PDZ domain-containing protein [Chloroflexota bacterium]|nr:PDZ domain-containing protein [Chloroflexota bacterium]